MNYNIFFDYIQKWFWDLGFTRGDYLKKLEIFDKANVVKVITWLRRVGKSYILKQFMTRIVENWFKRENIFYLHLDDYRLGDNVDLKLLWKVFEYFLGNIYSWWDFYIFLDEIQNISWWEKFIRTVQEKYNNTVHIFITWSNSNLLSSELSTLLTWRFVNLEVYPFSFQDYLDFKNIKLNSSLDTKKFEYFQDYLYFWALPEILKIDDKNTKTNYLLTLIDSILYKDIIMRYRLRKTSFLWALLKFIYSTTCSLFSINSILKYLKQDIKNLDYETVDNYITYLKNTYLINEVYSMNSKTKEILKSYRKFYSFDLGLRNVFSNNYDIEKMLENYVYLELKRRWYNVFVLNSKDYELDFFAIKEGKKVYFQVAYTLKGEKTYQREITPLLKQRDNYEKIILTMDEVDTEDRWVLIKNIINFSLTKN